MRKFILVLSILLLAVALCACSATKDPASASYTFPEGSALMGMDLTDLTKDAALSTMQEKIANYALTLSVDGVQQTVTGQQIDLAYDAERLSACIEALAHGVTPDPNGVISFNEGKLRVLMNQFFNHPTTEASVAYDEATGTFVLIPDADGQVSNPNAIVAAVAPAITALEAQTALTDVSQILKPVRLASDPEVVDALAAANKMLSTQLTYTFTPETTTFTHEIPADVLRSFISIDEDGFTPVIHQENLELYATELSEQYFKEGNSGKFVTTDGGTVNLTVEYSGSYVDIAALVADMAESIREGRNETRPAPYLNNGCWDKPYGGNYIEVDLSDQHLWFYKDGTCIVSTPLVSGNVSLGTCTPTGVFSLRQRVTDTYLVGEDYCSYVNFWMPFVGGYGLHDATWRWVFGGNIYLYGGSHGCVNLPYDAAAEIFNNSTVGTKVILYGGARGVEPVDQKLSGTTSYTVADDASGFKLDIKAKHGEPELTYSSSNPNVASVSADGTVMVRGVGTAKITVTALKHLYYTETSTTVTVNVFSACEEGRHKFGTPTQVKAPTCQPGLEKTTCSKCGHTVERELAAKNKHSYGEWVTTQEPTCKTTGTQERTCTTCTLQKETKTIAVSTKHTEGDWELTQKPTCIAEGTMQTKCTVCGTGIRTEKVPISGEHTLGDWQTVEAATCTTDGVKAKYCIHCNEPQEIDTIPAGHTPGDWTTVTEPSCSEPGKQVKYCTVCETPLEEAPIGTTSHSFNGGPSCSACGASNPSYTEPSDPEISE